MRIVSCCVGGVDYCDLADVMPPEGPATVEVRCPECEEWLDDCTCYYAELRQRGVA